MVRRHAGKKLLRHSRGPVRFSHADKVGKFTVFNIAGNKARLIAAIHYNRGKVYIRHILTHGEYDKGAWKK